MVGTNPIFASCGMAFLADRMAAMVLETAMPALAAEGIAAAAVAGLIMNGVTCYGYAGPMARC